MMHGPSCTAGGGAAPTVQPPRAPAYLASGGRPGAPARIAGRCTLIARAVHGLCPVVIACGAEWHRTYELRRVHRMAKRKSAAQVGARNKARELQAQFAVLEETRLETATRAIALQGDLVEFDAETERLVQELRAKRERRQSEMHAQLGALAEEMLETKVSKSEAAARMGLSVAEMNAARKAFNDAVRARAEASTPTTAPDRAPVQPASPPPPGVVPPAEPVDSGEAAAVVPQQSGPSEHDGGMAAVPGSPTAG